MDMAIVEGAELKALLLDLKEIAEDNEAYVIRFAVDGGIKIKVNGGMWSPPIGRMAVNGY